MKIIFPSPRTYFTTPGVVSRRVQETDADFSILKLQGNVKSYY